MFISSVATVGKNAPEHAEYQSNPYTPSDSADIPTAPDGGDCRAIYVGGAGNVAINCSGGGTALYTGMSAGQRIVCNPTRILATGTTATLLQVWY
jgi:hypothetical protein